MPPITIPGFLTFPDLTDGLVVLVPNEKFSETPEDVTVRTKTESGLVLTRPRFTRGRKTYQVAYDEMPDTAKNTLDLFVGQFVLQGEFAFIWYHPISGLPKRVRFIELPSFEYAGVIQGGPLWDVTFKLQEV